jgi:hypothetical protein
MKTNCPFCKRSECEHFIGWTTDGENLEVRHAGNYLRMDKVLSDDKIVSAGGHEAARVYRADIAAASQPQTPPVDKHTPGPWTVVRREHVHAIVCQPTRKGEHAEVAFIDRSATPFPGAPAGDLSAGSITAQQRSREELAANAALIAAAPDLLAACKFAYAHCDPTPGREEEWRCIAAAIAKATQE